MRLVLLHQNALGGHSISRVLGPGDLSTKLLSSTLTRRPTATVEGRSCEVCSHHVPASRFTRGSGLKLIFIRYDKALLPSCLPNWKRDISGVHLLSQDHSPQTVAAVFNAACKARLASRPFCATVRGTSRPECNGCEVPEQAARLLKPRPKRSEARISLNR